MSRDDSVIRKGLALVSGGEREAGYRLLLGELFDEVLRGICRVFAVDAPDHDAVVGDFLAEKFEQPKFLRQLEDAATPFAFVATAAHRFALDRATRGKDLFEQSRLSPTRSADDDDDVPLERTTGVARGFHGETEELEQLLPAPESSPDLAAVRDLPANDWLLLAVYFAVDGLVTDEQLVLLADRRGLPVDAIRQQLRQRIASQEEQRHGLQESMQNRFFQIQDLQRDIFRVSKVIEELDGKPAEAAALTNELKTKIRNSSKAIKKISPEERSGYLAHLEDLLVQRARKQQEDQDRLNQPLPGGHRYDEVARILGELAADAEENERKKAVNSVTVRIRRLRKKLRKGK